MPQATEYLPEKGFVLITYTGKVTIKEVNEATVQAIALQSEKATNQVVIDATAMTVGPSLVEMWELVQSYPQLDVPRRTRLAAIRPLAPDNTDISGFFEVVCQNQCYNAKAFDARDSAEAWVKADAEE